MHLLNTGATALHGRSDWMSCLKYQVGFILTHRIRKQRDNIAIERLAKLGLFTSFYETLIMGNFPRWRNNWYQEELEWRRRTDIPLDAWDKNIIPTYRTSQIKTISLHLFNVIAVLDSLRVIPSTSLEVDEMDEMGQMSAINYIPPNVIRLCSNGHIDNSKPGTNAWHFWTQSVWNLDTVNS